MPPTEKKTPKQCLIANLAMLLTDVRVAEGLTDEQIAVLDADIKAPRARLRSYNAHNREVARAKRSDQDRASRRMVSKIGGDE